MSTEGGGPGGPAAERPAPGAPYVPPASGRRRRPPVDDGRYVVGLTGGIASGKSTVARVLAAEGARLVAADRFGHAVLEEPEVAAALVREFGPGITDAAGRIRRAELGRLAFAAPDALARLNAISHPRLIAALERELAAVADAGYRGLVVLEAALLVEWDLGRWCDEVVAVVAPIERRRAWAAAALGIAPAEVDARSALQLSDEERVHYADRVLANDGTLADLERRARELAGALVVTWQARDAGRGRETAGR